MNAKTETIFLSDAKAGDIIWTHGSRFRLVKQYAKVEAGQDAMETATGWHAELADPIDTVSDALRSFLGSHECEKHHGIKHCWHIQSNNRCRWAREIAPAVQGEAR